MMMLAGARPHREVRRSTLDNQEVAKVTRKRAIVPILRGLSRAINPSTAGTAWFTTATARHAVPAHSSRAAPPVVIGGFAGGLKRPCLTGWKLG